MRVSDIMMSNSFLNNILKTKEKVQKLSTQIASSTKVERPSDAPESAVKILRLGSQISQNENYTKNINNSLAFLTETTFALESIQEEVSKVLVKLTELNNATNEQNYKTYADQIDLTLKAILDLSNSEADGKFIFGGTDFSASPFGFDTALTGVEVKANDLSGKQIVKLSSSTYQKINMSGTEIFGTVLSAAGSLNSTSAVGATYSISTPVFNSSKEEFSLDLTFTKTAENTYSLSYDLLDSTSTTIYTVPPGAIELKYDPVTGRLMTLDGIEASTIKIGNSDNKIDFTLDLNSIKEKNSASAVSFSLNQKTDIFNTLIRVRDDLRNGIKPSAEDEEMIKNFNLHMLNKTAEAGNIINYLTDAQELLINQKSVLDELISNEQEIDVAKAILELQNQDYLLQLAYKVSSSILPKSLLDYI